MDAVLDAAPGHQLHADADAEEGTPLAAHRLLQGLDHPGDRAQAATAVAERADARQHDMVGPPHQFRVGGHGDRPAVAHVLGGPGQGLGGRAQVAGPVIDDGNAHAKAESQPLRRSAQRRSALSAERPVVSPSST